MKSLPTKLCAPFLYSYRYPEQGAFGDSTRPCTLFFQSNAESASQTQVPCGNFSCAGHMHAPGISSLNFLHRLRLRPSLPAFTQSPYQSNSVKLSLPLQGCHESRYRTPLETITAEPATSTRPGIASAVTMMSPPRAEHCRARSCCFFSTCAQNGPATAYADPVTCMTGTANHPIVTGCPHQLTPFAPVTKMYRTVWDCTGIWPGCRVTKSTKWSSELGT